MSSSTAAIHDIKKMYEENEEYLRLEIARYAADYQRLAEERNLYEEKEEYLLSEIAHMVSGNPSFERKMARHKEKEDQLKTRINVLERCYAEKEELLRLAVEEGKESEKSFTHLLEEKSTTVIELIKSKKKLKEQVVMFSQLCNKHEQDTDQLNAKMHCLEQNYQDVVCERDALRYNLDTLLNNPNGNSSQEHIQEKINSLVEEKEELEERLSSVIEQKLSIQSYVDKYIASMEEEKTKLINECNKYKEYNDNLKVEYEGVIRENKESISSEFAELTRHIKELEKQLTKVEEKGKEINGDEDARVVVIYILLTFACCISILSGGNDLVAFMLLTVTMLLSR